MVASGWTAGFEDVERADGGGGCIIIVAGDGSRVRAGSGTWDAHYVTMSRA